jgi:hypothetical protein
VESGQVRRALWIDEPFPANRALYEQRLRVFSAASGYDDGTDVPPIFTLDHKSSFELLSQ